MSTSISARTVLDFALLQSAAECYLDGLGITSLPDAIAAKLREGANNALLQGKSADDPLLAGATRFTDAQAEWFTANYDIVTHYPNDSSGFSATVFRNKTTGEYTLSFRSTEYQFQAKGGDYERDGSDATDGDISEHGYALAQLSSMETFYAHLKQGETLNTATGLWETNPAVAAFVDGTPVLNVTGYSLGAHLSTSFTLMHAADVTATWNFNAAGVGGLSEAGDENTIPTGAGIQALIDFYDTLMHYDGTVPDNPLWNELVASSPLLGDFINTATAVQGQTFANVYDNPLHDIVMAMLAEKMHPAGAGGTLNPADSIGDSRFWDAIARFNPNNLNSFTSNLFEVNGQTSDAAWQKIHQFYGHGEFLDMEFVANSGWHVTPEHVFIEDLPLSRGLGLIELIAPSWRGLVGEFGETHSITPLVDSLTVFDMLQRIDADMDMAKFTALEKAIANSEHAYDNSSLLSLALMPTLAVLSVPLSDELEDAIRSNTIHDADALENTVNALHKLLLGSDPGLRPNTDPEAIAEGYGNLAERNALHAAIAAINGAVQTLQDGGANLQLQVLIGMSEAGIQAKAAQADAEGLAYRYALRELNPFVMAGADYTIHNADGRLDFHTAMSSGQENDGQLTESWIADRAALLAWKMRFDTGARDSDDDQLLARGNKPYSEDWDTNILAPNIDYIDLGTIIDGEPLTLAINGDGVSLHDHQIVFGSGNADEIEGSGDTDHLYGMAGDDRLDGSGGDDYLEGGAGFDTYTIAAGDGGDTILDTDGQGAVTFAGETLDGGARIGCGGWKSAGGTFTYRHDLGNPADLLVRHKDGQTLRIEGFSNGDLGIVLDNGSLATLPGRVDRVFGWGTRDDVVTTLGGDDFVAAAGGNDHVWGGEGHDMLYGDSGNDTLYGEAGLDQLSGGSGNDVLYGGSGHAPEGAPAEGDLLDGGTGNDLLVADNDLGDIYRPAEAGQGDWLNGRAGDDTLHGSARADFLAGGAGQDTLYGGAGDDVLTGDGDYRSDYDVYYIPVVNHTAIQLGIELGNLQAALSADPGLFLDAYCTLNQLQTGETVLPGGGIGSDWMWDAGDQRFEMSAPGYQIAPKTAENSQASAFTWHVEFADGAFTLVPDRARPASQFVAAASGGGADLLVGGAGNDWLEGGTGADTYHFELSDGRDTVRDGSAAGANVLSFGEGIGRDDVSVSGEADGLHIRYGHGGDEILALGDSADDAVFGEAVFADGARVAFADLLAPAENRAPVVGAPLPGLSADEDAPFVFAVPADAFVDEDGDALVLSALLANGSALPDWLAFDADTGTFSGTPAQMDVGEVVLRVTATDPGGASVFQDMALSVANVNDAPVAGAVLPATLQADEDAPFAFAVPADAFADEDGDPLALSATLADGSALPDWLAFDAATGTFSGTPAQMDVGEVVLRVTATDPDGASAYRDMALKVANVNDAPVAGIPISPQQARGGAPWSLALPAASFADEDVGDTLSYRFDLADESPLPEWLAFDPETNTLSGTPPLHVAGELVLRVTAADQTGETAVQSFTLAIEPGLPLVEGDAGNDILFGGGNGSFILGGDGNDTLIGGRSGDVLDGGSGNDLLAGTLGSDTYLFGRGGGHDRIVEFDWRGTDTDKLVFGQGISPDQLWFRRDGFDLDVSIIGTQDEITVTGWYLTSRMRVEAFETTDGRTLLDSQVNSLVDAMAAFAPPSAGQTILPDNYRTILEPALAANWQ